MKKSSYIETVLDKLFNINKYQQTKIMLQTQIPGFQYEKPICELLNVLPAVQCASPTATNEEFTQIDDFTW